MSLKRENCRLCFSSNIFQVLNLPECPPVDNFRYCYEENRHLPGFPMNLYLCRDCGHAQLADVVDPKVLFADYIYTSSSSPDLDQHFEGYCSDVLEYFPKDSKGLVIDIGSNDGLLLSKFVAKGWRVQGVDPAVPVATAATTAGIPTLISFLDHSAVSNLLSSVGMADIVTANNVFSHADDLKGFAECVRDLMRPEGLFVFEVSYLADLVRGKVFDYIYHEHLAHHSVMPIARFFESVDMRLFDVQHFATKGGSIRGFACLRDSSWRQSANVDKYINNEKYLGLYDDQTYVSLQRFINELRARTRDLIESMGDQRVIAGYGACATGTVLSYCLDIQSKLAFIVDDNPERQGRLSPGSDCPVLPSICLVEKKPKLTIILAWRFAEQIVKRNNNYLESGGSFLIPLPDFRIIRGGL
jgi:hypothetical protein